MGLLPVCQFDIRPSVLDEWVNQWRICFRFEAGNAFDVEIVDYH